MEKDMQTEEDRYKVSYDPHIMRRFSNEDSAWNESEADIASALDWGAEKQRLLAWVRKQMGKRLTTKQRRSIELRYFDGLSYPEIGEKSGCTPSAACRRVQRGIHRLRAAAIYDPPVVRKRRR